MKKYLIKKFIYLILILFGISFFSFFFLSIFGEDPAMTIALRGNTGVLSDEYIESIRDELGLNRPIIVRYFIWLKELFCGKLGNSLYSSNSISLDIVKYFPSTLKITALAILWIIIFVPIFSIIAAKFKNGIIDNILRIISIIGISLPVFWFGYLLLMGFAIKIPIFTVVPKKNISSFILPSFCLSFPSICFLTRIVRTQLLNELSLDYVKYSRSRGLSDTRILIHAFKNSLPPIITQLCQMIGSFIAGSTIVEEVFSIQGLGSYLVNSVISNDAMAVSTCVVIISSIYVLSSTIGEIISKIMCPWMEREANV